MAGGTVAAVPLEKKWDEEAPKRQSAPYVPGPSEPPVEFTPSRRFAGRRSRSCSNMCSRPVVNGRKKQKLWVPPRHPYGKAVEMASRGELESHVEIRGQLFKFSENSALYTSVKKLQLRANLC